MAFFWGLEGRIVIHMSKKITATILFLKCLNVFAVGEQGALNEINGPSHFSILFGIVVGAIFFAFALYMWILSAKDGKLDKDTNQLGCMAIVGIIGIIFFLFALCS